MRFSTAVCILLGLSQSGASPGIESAVEEPPYFASGVKIGEATQESVRIWVRLTAEPAPRYGLVRKAGADQDSEEGLAAVMNAAIVLGAEGEVRLRYWPAGSESSARSSAWQPVDVAADFTRQFLVEGLSAGTRYELLVEARADSSSMSRSTRGSFRTAAADTDEGPVRFAVSTCQAVRSVDAGPDGHRAYELMLALDPDFFVHTGDLLYYDREPTCRSVAEARAKWGLMFSYGHNREFFSRVSSYFMKDDHDTLKNDCWPGQSYGDLTFEQGLEVFREQVPMGASTYRTVRWGKHVQIWMTENRDFRSPNPAPDGPSKTILGAEQKAWLRSTLSASDATFKFVISPGPLVGPDKRGKSDNHSNAAFAFEGRELRELLSALPNTYVICGDRHWQYCSEDPKTGLIEMGCGPVNDQHQFGGNPGRDERYHRYFGARGGFLMLEVDGDEAVARWMGSASDEGADAEPLVLHSERFAAGG